MKSHIKTGYLFLYIAFISLLGIVNVRDIQSAVSYLVFFAAIAVLYLVKNKYVSYGLSILLLTAYAIYKINYAIFMIPVYLLIIIYRGIMRKIRLTDSKKIRSIEVGHTGLHFLILLGLGVGIYAVSISSTNYLYQYYSHGGEIEVMAVVLIAIFLIGLFSKKLEKEVRQSHKVNTKNFATLNLVNFVAMFLFFSSAFLNYAAYQDLQAVYQIAFFPWTVWLCVLVYEKNPITESILKLIEEEIKKISERRIKEK